MKCPTRLCTKDGRKVGNAFCISWNDEKPLTYNIETDFGNILKMTEAEIHEFWWVMDDKPPVSYEQWKAGKN